MSTDRLSEIFAALADPTRRAILTRLMAGEATVNELVAPFALRQPTISKHLQVLEQAGLISRRRDAQRRPCRLETAALEEAAAWFDSYRQFWDESLERLDTYMAHLKQEETKGQHDGPEDTPGDL